MLLQIESSFLYLKLFSVIKFLFQKFKKLASIPSKPWVTKPIWVPKQSWSITETMEQQSQHQISQIKETLILVGPHTFHDNILTELEKDAKTFAAGNLRYFSKN